MQTPVQCIKTGQVQHTLRLDLAVVDDENGVPVLVHFWHTEEGVCGRRGGGLSRCKKKY